MALGLILGIGRAVRIKRASSLDILTSKTGPRGYYKGKGCKNTGFHTRKGTSLISSAGIFFNSLYCTRSVPEQMTHLVLVTEIDV